MDQQNSYGKTILDIMSESRLQLRGKWGISILSCIIYGIVVALPSFIPIFGFVISILIGGPMMLGLYGYFLKSTRGQDPEIENLFEGFKNFVPALVMYLLMSLAVALGMILLVVPGIIIALCFSQAYYIMKDNPGISAVDAMGQSNKMMRGYKGKYFLLWLCFIGLSILCILTLGIGYFWLIPYIYQTQAHFYDELKNKRI